MRQSREAVPFVPPASSNGANGNGASSNGATPHGVSHVALPANAARTPSLTLVVPTRNEAGNIEMLIERLERVAPKSVLEIVFVDDSDDDTPAVIRRVAARAGRQVRLIHRPPGERGDGLGGAVLQGLQVARAPWICVMDADLQHPPELIEEMLARADSGDVDIVMASRFCESGQAETGFGRLRAAISAGSKAAAVLGFPVRLRGVTDPMSGFFMVRRGAIELQKLRPRGFKILLEILVRTPGLRRAEVPFEFGVRHAGESKASLHEGFVYLGQLGRLRLGDRLVRMGRFGIVGALGLAVNAAAFAVFLTLLGFHYLVAAVIATQVSTLWNFAGAERWVFRDRKPANSGKSRLGLYFVVNNVALLLRGPLLFVLIGSFAVNAHVANMISLIALGLARFFVADSWIWRGATQLQTTYRYSLHGIVSVESPVALRELERFRVPRLYERPTIRVRIGKLSRPQSELVTQLAFLARHTRYDEGLGRLGFAIEIGFGKSVEVLASPLLGWSPHVLYTNVIEPIIRWSLVRRDYALVHGACVAYGGEGVMITARTDTGKTTTVLKLLDTCGGEFLSDDLTIVGRDGTLLAYPKPMTISRHTVAAIRTPLLSWRERMALIPQSRIHSRSGRQFAFALTKSRLPIATINAIVQLIVPPPKYHVERLVPGVRMASGARLGRFIVIERGGTGSDKLDEAEAAGVLRENSDDAFGFPPYSSIVDFLRAQNGQDLEAVEHEIVRSALRGVPAVVLRSETMDWFERISANLGVAPQLQNEQAPPEAAVAPALT